MPEIISIDQISVPASIFIGGFEPGDRLRANASAIDITVPVRVAASLAVLGLLAGFFFRRHLTLA
jgi:hypothetical protein